MNLKNKILILLLAGFGSIEANNGLTLEVKKVALPLMEKSLEQLRINFMTYLLKTKAPMSPRVSSEQLANDVDALLIVEKDLLLKFSNAETIDQAQIVFNEFFKKRSLKEKKEMWDLILKIAQNNIEEEKLNDYLELIRKLNQSIF